MIAATFVLGFQIIIWMDFSWLATLFMFRCLLHLIARLPGPLERIDMGSKEALIEIIIAGSAVILGITKPVPGELGGKIMRVFWIICYLAECVAKLTRLFRSKDTGPKRLIIGIMIVGSMIIIESIDSPHGTRSVEGKVVGIILTIGYLAVLVRELTSLFRRNDTEKVLVGILVGAIIIVGIIGSLSGTDASLESCKDAHRAAYAQAEAPARFGLHRSLENDTDITNCPSAAKGDYGPCLRNSLNHSQYDGRVTYDTTDTMKFFLRSRPRLLQQPPRSSLFNILSSDKPSFDVSRLSPTQQEGLVLWSKCTYPRFGQTLTQPLNLSCPFQAFNLLFFHNTLGDGQMFLPTKSIYPDPPPEHTDYDLQSALAVSLPQKDTLDRAFPRRILHIGATPLLEMTPLKIEHSPHNLAKILSQLLHEMLHVTQYIYTCPICYSDQCAAVDHPDMGGLRYRQMWLPLTVAIDLLLANVGILEIPGVNWKEHRLDLHADRVAAVMKDPRMWVQMQAELNGEDWGSWEDMGIGGHFFAYTLKEMADGALKPGFPSSRPDSAPYVVA